MKKLICILLSTLLLSSYIPISSEAATSTCEIAPCFTIDNNYLFFNDGSYVVVTIEEEHTKASASKSGSKRLDYYNSNDELSWYAILRGSFSYDGITSVCTSSSCNVTIISTSHKLVSKSVGKYDNVAYADIDMGILLFNILIGSTEYSFTLSCDKNGNLS